MARDEFARRRRQLMRLMGRDSIAVLPAAPVRHRNNDVEYPYRQDSDFHYLTGFGEPEAVAVLVPGRAQAEYILFVRDRDPARETWDGRRAGPAGAARDYGARRCLSRSPTSTRSCPGCSRTARGCSTPWARTRTSTSAWSAGSTACAPRRATAATRRRSSWRSITCCTTCGSTSRARELELHAHRGADRRTRAPARDALLPPRRHRVPGDGGAAARVPPPQRRYRLPADRRRRRQQLHPALPRQRPAARRTATCCWSMPAASSSATPPTSPAPIRSTAASPPSSARSTRWCSRRTAPRSRKRASRESLERPA